MGSAAAYGAHARYRYAALTFKHQDDVAAAQNALTEAQTKVTQLTLQRVSLGRKKRKAQAPALRVAKEALETATRNLTNCKQALRQHLEACQILDAQDASAQGALLGRCLSDCGPPACAPRCHVIATPSLLLPPPLAIVLLPPLCSRDSRYGRLVFC